MNVKIGRKTSGNWTQSHAKQRLEFCSEFAVIRAAVNTSGRLVAFADKLGAIYVLDLSQKRFQLSARVHSSVTCLAFVDSECCDVTCHLVATTAAANRIHFFELCFSSLLSQSLVSIECSHKSTISDVTFDTRERMMTSSAYDSSLVWNLLTFRSNKTLNDKKCQKSLFFGPNLALSVYRETLFVCDSKTFQLLLKFEKTVFLQKYDKFFATKSLENNDISIHETNNETIIASKRMPRNERQFDEKIIARKEDMFLLLNSNSNLVLVFEKKAPKVRKKKRSEEKSVRDVATQLLAKYSRFPEKYRFFIYAQIMGIPIESRELHKNIESLSRELIPELRETLREFKFISETHFSRLLSLLAQLIHFKPQILNDCLIENLSLFCFPFAKQMPKELSFFFCLSLVHNNFLFDKKLEKTQVLALIRKVLEIQSKQLAKHFLELKVENSDFSIPLMTSFFSEVFLRSDWFRICDHCVTFGPQFFVYLVIGFCLESRETLLKLETREQIKTHFRSQSRLSANRVIACAHSLAQQYLPLNPYSFQTPL